jgi:hypothetical protein
VGLLAPLQDVHPLDVGLPDAGLPDAGRMTANFHHLLTLNNLHLHQRNLQKSHQNLSTEMNYLVKPKRLAVAILMRPVTTTQIPEETMPVGQAGNKTKSKLSEILKIRD